MILYRIPTVLTLCSFLALAALSLARGQATRLNRLFLWQCLLASLIYISFLFSSVTASATHALWASRLDHFLIPFLLPLYIDFFQTYLERGDRRWVRLAYGYAAVLICMAPLDGYISGMQQRAFGFVAEAGPLYALFVAGEAAATVYALGLLVRAIRLESHSVRKNRLKYVLVGFGSLGILNGFNFLSLYGAALYPPGNFSFISLGIFAVGLFKHDLLDMGILIHRGLIYSFLTALLTCIYAVLVIAADRFFSGLGASDSVLLPVGFFVLITLVFGPLKTGVQKMVDRCFYRGKYDYQETLKALSRQIVSLLDVGAIGEQLLEAVDKAMKVNCCCLLLKDIDGCGTGSYFFAGGGPGLAPPLDAKIPDALVRFMSGHRRPVAMEAFEWPMRSGVPLEADIQGAMWGFPLVFQEHLNGVLLMGQKRSGALYSREDFDLLETLCGQSALAIENALSYQQIERLNNALEKKVAERTRALQDALKEKERTQEQLIRSESLAAIGQLVAGVAHELNNPLATATSLVQSTMEDLGEAESALPGMNMLREDMAFVEKELSRAKGIVRSLLGLSRQTENYREKVNLNAVAEDACRILHNQHRHSPLRIETDYMAALPTVSGNFATLGQVALNIIQNAIHAVTGKTFGRILLTTHYEEKAGEVVFECVDSGAGMSQEIQKDIFKPFFTTKEVGQGTGLGLYISHEIVRKHGGSLSFDSALGRGTRFTMRLPASV